MCGDPSFRPEPFPPYEQCARGSFGCHRAIGSHGDSGLFPSTVVAATASTGLFTVRSAGARGFPCTGAGEPRGFVEQDSAGLYRRDVWCTTPGGDGQRHAPLLFASKRAAGGAANGRILASALGDVRRWFSSNRVGNQLFWDIWRCIWLARRISVNCSGIVFNAAHGTLKCCESFALQVQTDPDGDRSLWLGALIVCLGSSNVSEVWDALGTICERLEAVIVGHVHTPVMSAECNRRLLQNAVDALIFQTKPEWIEIGPRRILATGCGCVAHVSALEHPSCVRITERKRNVHQSPLRAVGGSMDTDDGAGRVVTARQPSTVSLAGA